MLKAVCVLSDKVRGYVTFTEMPMQVKIELHLEGLKRNAKHGFHIHDGQNFLLSGGCGGTTCSHFNPFQSPHGGPSDNKSNRHVGDLGNIVTDENGKADYVFYDSLIKLHGKCNIIGKLLVIHANEDDLGQGNTPVSLTTGNSGKRIACGFIGWNDI